MFFRFLSILFLATLAAPSAASAAEPKRPNILVIVADDQMASMLGCYGNPLARTPNLDRLARSGVRFDRAYCNSPICTPSRQALLTGRLPRANRVTQLTTPLPDGLETLPKLLTVAGYRTGAFGKMHLNGARDHGFEITIDRPEYDRYRKENPARPIPAGARVKPAWKPFQDPARIWLNAECLPYPSFRDEMPSTWITDQAIRFAEQSGDQPFCMWLSLYEPHSPFDFPLEYAGRYNPKTMPVPPVLDADDKQIPAIFRGLSRDEKQGIAAAYHASMEFMDWNVGRMLAALKRLGKDRDTIVIFLGDNGYNLGHHGRFEKHSFWETAVRVPLLVAAPERIRAGRSSNALVELIDLPATLLDLVGLPKSLWMQGKSFASVLRGEKSAHRSSVYSEYLFGWREAMIRTERWKLIFVKGDMDRTDGYETAFPRPGRLWRLFDLEDDPGEARNLASSLAHEAVRRDLESRMLQRLIEGEPPGWKRPSNKTDRELIELLLESTDQRPR